MLEMALRTGILSDGETVVSLAIMWSTGMEMHLESNLLNLRHIFGRCLYRQLKLRGVV